MQPTKPIVVKQGVVAGQIGQNLDRVNAIAPETIGVGEIYMALVTVPPGARAIPHAHENTHTSIYVLSGTVKTYYGEKLEEVCETSAGDFLYIPPGVIHCAVNETDQPGQAVIARTPANEIVTEYPDIPLPGN
jgi:uncharacterized RmlC-like cupin family protein